jgi:glyoxylase-like metal-dependent hydrolase (beta-lactamase superfamily II)
MATRSSTLQVEAFTAAPAAFSVTSTLVSGARDALLIDAQFALGEAALIAEAILATGKRLTTIYVSHWHPDHYLGLPALLDAYPEARVVALPETVERIRATAAEKIAQWKPSVGDAIPDEAVIPEPLDGELELEGEQLRIALVGQADTEGNSAVYIESADTLVTGDFTYNGTHLWLVETTPAQWQEWVANVDRLEALGARHVIAGHRAAWARDDASAFASTRDYIRDFAALASESSSAAELVEKVQARHGDRELGVVLDLSAAAVFPG